MSELAIRVENLSKCYALATTHNMTVADAAAYKLRQFGERIVAGVGRIVSRGPVPVRDSSPSDFWALRDVSFDLKYGEVMGIIGRNGAGKSTLLKIISQVTLPTEGRAQVFGRVGSLLEVGTGFNPELSGRENIFLYGSILGMTRSDIERRFDEIVAFSEIERFLEEPIKHYSSGMHSRLGFSVAAHLECDILLIDEVLAVGDAAFSDKCLKKMDDVTAQGRAVLFVSHAMPSINRMCHSGMVLESGRMKFLGAASDAVNTYLQGVAARPARENAGLPESGDTDNPALIDKDDAAAASIVWMRMANAAGETTLDFEYTEAPMVELEFELRQPSRDYFVSAIVENLDDEYLIHATDQDEDESELSRLPAGRYFYRVTLPKMLFAEGRYHLTVGIERKRDGRVHKLDRVFRFNIHHRGVNAPAKIERSSHLFSPKLRWKVAAYDAGGSDS